PNAPFGAVLKTKRTLVWFKKTKRALGGVFVKPNAPLVGRGGSSGVVEVSVMEVMVVVVSVGWRWCCYGVSYHGDESGDGVVIWWFGDGSVVAAAAVMMMD
ncbi:hypothetical protein Tco_0419506, partial [Tanacetum coccineum]